MLKAKLVIVGAKTKVTEVNLRLPATIGRGRDATLTVKHPLISRMHCKITELRGELVVEDLGSLNGTYISNEQLEPNEQYILPPDELLTVGGVTFRAVYEAPSGEFDSESTQTGAAIPWVADPDDTCDEASVPEAAAPVDTTSDVQTGDSTEPLLDGGAAANSPSEVSSDRVDDLLPPAAVPPTGADTLSVEPKKDQ